MRASFSPSHPAGTVAAPPSKSMAHRYLIGAALARGETEIRGVVPSQDLLATMDCLRALGAECFPGEEGVTVVRSRGLSCADTGIVLPCRESGSTLRFLLPLCLSGPTVILTGEGRLMRRPMNVYADLCRERGILFEQTEDRILVRGVLGPGEFRLRGDWSSQFVSGLLFALPGLAGDSVISLTAPAESRSYIDMTLDALKRYGVEARWQDSETLLVLGKQRFLAPAESDQPLVVEGDWSNAANCLAMGLSVTGLREDSRQGDRICAAHFKALEQGRAEIDLSDCPDLGPVLMAYAALHHGALFTGTRRLAMKESDRRAAMREELARFGIDVRLGPDRVAVDGVLHAPSGPLSGHNDHRIVMALSVLCAVTGGTIDGAEAVNKSDPAFFDRIAACGARLTLSE